MWLNAMVLFLFPLDFIRFFWIITPFDLVAATYIAVQIVVRSIDIRLLKIALAVSYVFAVIVLANSLANQGHVEENLVLLAGTVLSVLKAVALVAAIQSCGTAARRPLVLGFLAINAALIASFLMGLGFTGSGRFSGFFPHSSGLAAYANFALASGLYAVSTGAALIGLMGVASSVLIIGLTGSRGAALFAVATLIIWFISRSSQLSRWAVIGLGAVSGLLVLLFIDGGDILVAVGRTLQMFDIPGLQRIAAFLMLSAEIGLDPELDVYRSALNQDVIEAYVEEPRLWGFGYGSSADVSALGIRAHNIVLVSLYELGVLAFLGVVGVFMGGLIFIMRNAPSRDMGLLLSLWVFLVLANAMKTPYYFLNGISWAVIFVSIYFLVRPHEFRKQFNVHG